MTENNFLKDVLYNPASHSISIIFSEKMKSKKENDSYTLPINYAIKDINNKLITLNKASDKVYFYDDTFITFYLKPDYYYLIDNLNIYSPHIHCGYTSLKNIYYISSALGIIQDISKSLFIEEAKKAIPIELSNCSISLISNNSISIKSPDKTYFGEIYFYDFYISDSNNTKKIFPTSYKKLSYSEIILYFNIALESSSDWIMHTSSSCKSIDAFGLNIIGGYKSITNDIPSKLKKVSVSSHEDGKLSLIALATNGVLRYDAMDFEVLINDKSYKCTNREPYSFDNLLKISVNDVYDFNFSDKAILLRSKDNSVYYTLDEKNKPIIDLSGAYAEYFSAESGSIYYSDYSNSGSIKLLVTFNRIVDTLPHISEKGKLTTIDKGLEFSIDNIGTLTLFGSTLTNPNPLPNSIPNPIPNSSADPNYEVELFKYENILTATIKLDSNNNNFISPNKNKIKFINFKPDSNLKSLDGIFAFTTFEAPISILSKTTTTISLANSAYWNTTLNGTTFDGSLILEINKSGNKVVGSITTDSTIVTGDLLIKQVPGGSLINNLITIDNFKVQGDIYILTDADFNFNINKSSCLRLIAKENS